MQTKSIGGMAAAALFAAFVAVGVADAGEASSATPAKVKLLSAPDKIGGKPLMAALAARHAARQFADTPLSDQQISNLLWAAFGVNRPDDPEKRRTAPTARNVQDIEVYILLPDGAHRYDAINNALVESSDKDVRTMGGGAGGGGAVLVYVHDTTKNANEITAAMHAGSIYQNAGLYCASEGLNNVVRMSFQRDALTQALGLPETQKVLVVQAVGLPPN